MIEEQKKLIEKAVKIIKEVGLTSRDIEKYEDCEIISDLLDNEMLKLTDDLEFRKVVRKMRDLHEKVRRMNYAAYIDMAKELFGKIPNRNYVLRYHELEQLSKKISDEDIKKIKDENVRDTLEKVKHVHDQIAEKKANIIRRIKMY